MKLNKPTSTFEGQYRNKNFIPLFNNSSGVPTSKGGLADGPLFNALMLKRNGPYGYGTHAQFRRNPNHPVLRNEKSSSELSIMAHTTRDVLDAFGTPTGETKTTFDMTNYTLPPVSFRGRPAYLNFYSSFAFDDCGDNTIVGPGTTTLKIADNLFKIYFNSHGLNTHTEVDPRNVITPLDYVLSIVDYPEGTPGAPADVNWLVYTENVFPSNRMDFVSSSRRRTNYNNLFWRDTPADRIALGATVDTSCFIRGGLKKFLKISCLPSFVW